MISDTMVAKIRANSGSRRIAAYGWNSRTFDELLDKGTEIEKCFTANRNLLEEDPEFFCALSDMKQKNREYYIVILVTVSDRPGYQRDIMKEYGFTEIKDYVFVTLPETVTVDKPSEKYTDIFGNVISGLPKNTAVTVCGWGNKIKIDPGISFTGKLRITVRGSDNEIEIGKGFKVTSGTAEIICSGSFSKMRVKENCRFTNANCDTHIRFRNNGLFYCGKNTVIAGLEAILINNTFIEIGADCSISGYTIAQTGGGNSVFDLASGRNSSSAVGRRRGITVGDHVWIGIRSFLKPCNVGNGSVVGAQSVVKGRYPNNCLITGSPACVIKKNIAWTSESEAEDLSSCMGYTDPTDPSVHISQKAAGDRLRIEQLEKRVAELEKIISEMKTGRRRRRSEK